MKTSAGKDEAVGRKEWGAKTKKIPSYQSAAEVFLNKDFPRSCWSSHRKDSTLPSFGSPGSPCSESASPHDCLSLNVPSGLRFKHSWNVFFETSYSHIQTKRLIWFCLFPDGRSPLRQGRHRSSRVKLFSRCNPTAPFSQTSNPVSSASSSWSLTFHRVPKPSHKHRKQSKKKKANSPFSCSWAFIETRCPNKTVRMRRGLATTQCAIMSKFETCGSSGERRVDTEVTVAPWIPLRALLQHQPPGRLSLFQHQLRHSLRKLFSSDAALNRKNAASTSFPAPFSLFRLITIQCLPSNRLIDGKQPNQIARFCDLGFYSFL